jgi:transposase
LDEGTSYRDIEEKLGAAPSTVSRWKQRYEKDRRSAGTNMGVIQ